MLEIFKKDLSLFKKTKANVRNFLQGPFFSLKKKPESVLKDLSPPFSPHPGFLRAPFPRGGGAGARVDVAGQRAEKIESENRRG